MSYEMIEESRRFGILVRRYDLLGEDHDLMIEAIRSDSPDLAIVRIPTVRTDLIRKLQSLFSDVVIGDCLVVYERDNFKLGIPGSLRNAGFRLKESDSGDVKTLDHMNASVFNGYRNHYSANPRLERFDLVEAYSEWTRSHVDSPPCKCFLALLDNDPCAFCAVRIDHPRSMIDLNGVMPEFRGRGIYSDLLKSIIKIFIDEGCSYVTISTQVQNLAVQRVWVKEGFFMVGSYFTVHLNIT
ncbi:MAG: GNAT family N-acetyltransferase [Desulfomonilaceae bacterium]